MPTNDERREAASKLRDMACRENPNWPALMDLLGCPGRAVAVQCLADLIEPEERTCHIEPLSLHETFAGEKYTLSSDARESAESERFDRLSRELEEDARFTCSNCHVLFGTHEVANADYDILEDGTYEVSGVMPSINFCPFCGAKVIHDA